MQIYAYHLGYKTRGEHNDRFFFISGHFCAPQDKVVSKSVVFCQILGKQSHEKTKSQILGCFLSFGNCVTSKWCKSKDWKKQ